MMQIPVQISFRNMDKPMGLEEQIRDKTAALERFHPRITGCRVMIERRHHRRWKGDLFHVRIDVTVPGAELVVTREPAPHHAHRDLLVTIHDAFDEMRRKIEDHVREVRPPAKRHEPPPHGRIARLFPHEGYGFIQTPDGQEVYFQRASVADDKFDALEEGDEVRFFAHPGEGDKGDQASTVTPIGKHHLPPA